ncbi:OLC1v1038093C1 [Oldenlandia corymbosa var. corymbosa]|uniref:OLC1v1038093C1 n=1 Tax=Oldenlandia corymbosa var. corymbosa TaxID=529605 RepID=A0AAV1D237_OLDCO|nr:OLC1v1038093C1 [Oldenlandia corymbosa var. corymbosa]
MAQSYSVLSIFTTLVIVLCLAIWAPATCSADQNVAGGINFLGLPWGLPCLQSVIGTDGCVQEVVSSFLSLQPRFLGPQCCRASITVDDNCWPKIFPLNPFFPPLLKSFCASQLPPTTPPSTID